MKTLIQQIADEHSLADAEIEFIYNYAAARPKARPDKPTNSLTSIFCTAGPN